MARKHHKAWRPPGLMAALISLGSFPSGNGIWFKGMGAVPGACNPVANPNAPRTAQREQLLSIMRGLKVVHPTWNRKRRKCYAHRLHRQTYRTG